MERGPTASRVPGPTRDEAPVRLMHPSASLLQRTVRLRRRSDGKGSGPSVLPSGFMSRWHQLLDVSFLFFFWGGGWEGNSRTLGVFIKDFLGIVPFICLKPRVIHFRAPAAAACSTNSRARLPEGTCGIMEGQDDQNQDLTLFVQNLLKANVLRANVLRAYSFRACNYEPSTRVAQGIWSEKPRMFPSNV